MRESAALLVHQCLCHTVHQGSDKGGFCNAISAQQGGRYNSPNDKRQFGKEEEKVTPFKT